MLYFKGLFVVGFLHTLFLGRATTKKTRAGFLYLSLFPGHPLDIRAAVSLTSSVESGTRLLTEPQTVCSCTELKF